MTLSQFFQNASAIALIVNLLGVCINAGWTILNQRMEARQTATLERKLDEMREWVEKRFAEKSIEERVSQLETAAAAG
jgi:predicted KAP-like P-loop ATPase